MNSRQRRKLEAQQHNDAIRYNAWLKANAVYSRLPVYLQAPHDIYTKAKRVGLSTVAALILAGALQ